MVRSLLRNIRKRLRMIEYYSATRPRNGWNRAMDASLPITLVLALPVTWLCDVMVMRPVRVEEHAGVLSRTSAGDITAAVQDAKTTASSTAMLNVPIGVFRAELVDHRHGWPLTTTVRRQPLRVHLDLRIEPGPRPNAILALDDPLRVAIAQNLSGDGRHDMLRAWPAPDRMPTGRQGVHITRHWLSWSAAAGVWWLMLAFVLGAAIQLLKFGATLLRARRDTRRALLRAQGKCHTCGYDMTGLDFNERCPECGELVW